MRGRGRQRSGALVLAALTVAALFAAPAAPAAAAVASVQRLAGDDRFETSAAISASTFSPGVATAYIAAGLDFPDALSGSAAARARSAPVLLTLAASLPAATAGELTRLRPGRIIVLGGEGVISAGVMNALAAYTAGAVTRIAGADRYATSAAVSAATFAAGAPVAYLVDGTTYADALAAAPAAGRQGGPILLTGRTALPAAVRAELVRLRPARVVIAGGTGAVSAAVADAAAAATGAPVQRLAGADRYATAAAIAAATFPDGAPTVSVASGADFPDALSGAAAAADGPLLLTTPGSVPVATAREIIRLAPGRILVLGGAGAVSATVSDRLTVVGTSLTAATGGVITSSTEVRAGSCLTSPDASHRLCVGIDGEISVHRGTTLRWRSWSADASPRALRVRGDGNAVLYSVDGRIIWQTSTSGTAATSLTMADAGDALLRTSAGAVLWSTMTSPGSPVWRLPYATGQSWAAGAPHSSFGTGQGARGSLDFGPRAGGSTRVLAIAPGTVYRVQCGAGSYLGISHAGGWQSTYYHLVNEQTQLVGTTVAAGTYLGDVGRTLPCGGGATFDHVHLTIRRAGAPVSVEGMTFGGYTVRSGGSDYWGHWVDATGRRVVTAPGGAACCLLAR
ncbi:cell wall-binding repeat-containing protein [Microbacterium hominis]|uniref:Cell wall-binding repeat-containing protein n=1 Tax=Microbacterium hominis TaxID=162426 RepID=A0A7D4PV55_9MICO|nr:cell wall-binding repeat-containing protein [Microbacterium hominis]QKJ19514.1 cell wall-binding repeat-containing protein [Microbacterium hominis]